jgi:hypothetical protein
MDGGPFRAPPAVGQSLSPAHAAELSEDGEIFDSKLRYFAPSPFSALPTRDISRPSTELA